MLPERGVHNTDTYDHVESFENVDEPGEYVGVGGTASIDCEECVRRGWQRRCRVAEERIEEGGGVLQERERRETALRR